jgi:hypothetical protein
MSKKAVEIDWLKMPRDPRNNLDGPSYVGVFVGEIREGSVALGVGRARLPKTRLHDDDVQIDYPLSRGCFLEVFDANGCSLFADTVRWISDARFKVITPQGLSASIWLELSLGNLCFAARITYPKTAYD